MKVNKNGNLVEWSFDPYLERYTFDFKLGKGWIQYDTKQDASYFGIWVNPEKRKIITFAEGEIETITCPTEKGYHAELKNMSDAYGSPPPAFRIISQGGQLTELYDKRPE